MAGESIIDDISQLDPVINLFDGKWVVKNINVRRYVSCSEKAGILIIRTVG